MRYYLWGVTFLLFILFSSCSGIRYIDIQILNPSSVNLPKRIDQCFIINHEIFKNKDDSVVQNSIGYQIFEENFGASMKTELSKSPLFDSSEIIVCNLKSLKQKTDSILNRSNKICLMVNIDTMVLEDHIFGKIIDNSDDENAIETIVGVYQLNYSFSASIGFVKNRHLIENFKFSDTLFWSNTTHDLKSTITTLPDIKHAAKEAGSIAGQNYVRHLAPVWTTEERILYFSTNRLMRKAYQKFLVHDISGAVKIWINVYNNSTRNLATRAAFNVALMYELMDDLNASEEWLRKSAELCQMKSTSKYSDKIKKRQQMQLELDKQLLN